MMTLVLLLQVFCQILQQFFELLLLEFVFLFRGEARYLMELIRIVGNMFLVYFLLAVIGLLRLC